MPGAPFFAGGFCGREGMVLSRMRKTRGTRRRAGGQRTRAGMPAGRPRTQNRALVEKTEVTDGSRATSRRISESQRAPLNRACRSKLYLSKKTPGRRLIRKQTETVPPKSVPTFAYFSRPRSTVTPDSSPIARFPVHGRLPGHASAPSLTIPPAPGTRSLADRHPPRALPHAVSPPRPDSASAPAGRTPR